MRKLSVIIIDDERSARDEIRRLLEPYAEFIIVGEARDADEAKLKIEQLNPDIIFLDIQMPEQSGFDLLETLSEVPEVIFSTAYDEYAVQAFEKNALDYLMKPIRIERFSRAITKILDKFPDSSAAGRRIFVKDGSNYYFVPVDKIYLIESKDNYACLHFERRKVLIKTSLTQLEEKLGDNGFFRINRAQIINTHYIEAVTIGKTGGMKVKLITGEILDVSERQSIKLKTSYRF